MSNSIVLLLCVRMLFSPKACPSSLLVPLFYALPCHDRYTSHHTMTHLTTHSPNLSNCVHGTISRNIKEHDSNTIHCFVSCPSSLITPPHNTNAAQVMHTVCTVQYTMLYHTASTCFTCVHVYGYLPETDGRSQYSLLDST